MADSGRRSSTDAKWIACRKLIDKRDKRQCQFEKCLSAKEFYQLAPGNPQTLDRAHIFAASERPDQIYNLRNVITLRRFIHRRMDDFKSPLTDENIDLNTHWYWWYRIVTFQVLKYDENEDYEKLLMSTIMK